MTERDREPQGEEPGGGPPPDRSGLRELKARLAAARSHDKPAAGDGKLDQSGVAIAVRVGIEMVGSLAVGVGIGWGLDRWLGTGPWLMVVFFFLGAAAGMLNVYRAVTNIGLAPGYRTRTGDEEEDEGGGR
jgi:ATP synthase protein I